MQVKALPQCPFKSTLRVAVVKQSTYCDLYTDPFAKSAADLLASSIHRTGPIGLFINFDTQFIIVHPEPEAECRVWEEKLAYEVKGSDRAERFPKLRKQQAAVSVSARDVDWSQFDLVIAIENAVPSTIAQQYPSVLWCTQLEHHRLAPYQKYLRRAPAGYDAFLHHRYGPNLGSILHKSHVVDFPYGLNSVGGLSSIYSEIPKEKRQVMLEDHQDFVQLVPLLIKKKLRWKHGGEIAGSHQRRGKGGIVRASDHATHAGQGGSGSNINVVRDTYPQPRKTVSRRIFRQAPASGNMPKSAQPLAQPIVDFSVCPKPSC